VSIFYHRYYPLGHKEFLSKFPDELGRKTRSLMRIPLWERPEIEDKENPASWCTEDWLTGIDKDTANFPILCRVERTYAEFPPDPFTKTTKKIDDGTNVKVVWKAPKDPTALPKKGTPLRLAVELRPLASVLPPQGPSNGEQLPLPPAFSVATFPSREAKPFLIPFSWAYSIYHTLFLDDNAKLRESGDKSRVTGMASLGGDETRSCRFDDKADEISRIVSSFDRSFSKARFLESSLASAPKDFPLHDGHVVVDTLRHFLESRRESVGSSEPESVATDPAAPSFDLFNFIKRTLPLWEGVSILRNLYNRKTSWVSPWELVPSKEGRMPMDVSPDGLAITSKAMDENLRMKIDFVIEDFAEQNVDGDDFYYDITDDVAPSYSCAVPVGMSVEKILRRLRSPSNKKMCFYRGVEPLLSDIGLILENCLLYNSPDSEVVETGTRVISSLKEAVLQVSRNHFQELQEVSKADEDRRRLVLRTCGIVGQNLGANAENRPNSANIPAVVNTIKNPFKEKLDQAWLQGIDSSSSSHNELCIPRAGDKILYSRQYHSFFVKGHYRSLEPFQCIVPALPESENEAHSSNPDLAASADVSDWLSGSVIWVRAAFPKAPSKKTGAEDADTFLTSSTLMVLRVRFDSQSEDDGQVIFWRPCLFPCDKTESNGVCAACGLSRAASFLRVESSPTEDANRAGEATLTPNRLSSIDKCISLLKRKCIRSESPAELDPNFTKKSVRQGFIVPPARIGSKTLPSFEDLFTRGIASSEETKVGTRGISDTRELGSEAPSLVEYGFLPQWVSTSIVQSFERLSVHETVSPWARLSLELVLLRLKNGYYHQTAAIQNDIIEAYVSTVYLLLLEAAGRRKGPVSFRRIARLVSTNRKKADNPNEATHGESQEEDDPIALEESAWASRIRKIRDVHSMALLSVTDSSRIERLLGLASYEIPARIQSRELADVPKVDPVRTEAFQTIKLISSALGRDQNRNTFGALKSDDSNKKPAIPQMKVMVVCDGDYVSNASYSRRQEFVTAERGGKLERVRMTIGGKTVSRLLPLRMPDPSLGGGIYSDEHSQTSDSCFSVRVNIECNGTRIRQGNQSSAVASLSFPGLGDRNVVRLVGYSLTFKKADYEGSDTLVRFLYGRPGRMQPCARCQCYKRSLFSCRVKRGHSNVDFDWISTFKGKGGLDGILLALNAKNDVEIVDGAQDAHLENGTVEKVTNKKEEDDNAEGRPKTSNEETSQEENKRREAEDTETLKRLRKAKATLSLAQSVLKDAENYSKAPPRFSKEFIAEAFPVDPTDGHYHYCIVCGLSGDLLCCDGCSNVVHNHCVSLGEVPEGDWFCEECERLRPTNSAVDRRAESNEEKCGPQARSSDELTADRKAGEVQGDNVGVGGITTSDDSKTDGNLIDSSRESEAPRATDSVGNESDEAGSPSKDSTTEDRGAQLLPFGRVEFDEERAQQVADLLDELNSLRPENKRRASRHDIDSAPVPARAKRGRPRKHADSDNGEEPSDDGSHRQRPSRSAAIPIKRLPSVAGRGSSNRKRRRLLTGNSSTGIISVETGYNLFGKTRPPDEPRVPVARSDGKRRSCPPSRYQPPVDATPCYFPGARSAAPTALEEGKNIGSFTEAEAAAFHEAYSKYGTQFEKYLKMIPTRSLKQIGGYFGMYRRYHLSADDDGGDDSESSESRLRASQKRPQGGRKRSANPADQERDEQSAAPPRKRGPPRDRSRGSAEPDKKRNKRGDAAPKNDDGASRSGPWSDEEKSAFRDAYERYGMDYDKIAPLVPTRSLRQIQGYCGMYRRYNSSSSE